MAMGVDTPNVVQLIAKHNALCKLVQILVFGFSMEQIQELVAKNLSAPCLKSYSLKATEKPRLLRLQKLAHVIQLLYELKCIEGIFCITSALTTQLMSRIFSDEQMAQINQALSGQGPWLRDAGRENLEKGHKTNSPIAEKFYQNGKLIYNNDQYVAFFRKGDNLYKPPQLLQENTYYTIQDLSNIVMQQLNVHLQQFTNLESYAKKLGKPINALELIDAKGNYSFFRNLLKLSIRDKQVFIPYMGILRRDLIFTMEGGDNYVDSAKRFMNFRKASVLYEYVLTYLSPQMNFLGYQHEDPETFLSQNIVARRIVENSQDELIVWMRSFAEGSDSLDMWDVTEFAKPRKVG